MTLQHARTLLSVVLLFSTFLSFTVVAETGQAQAQAQASTQVSAELTKGKLNPASSKPGDQITVRLKEDLKSNGQVVLKKGSEITGLVKAARRLDGKAQGTAETGAQSMMQIEWKAPSAAAGASQQLNLALQSVAYTSPLYAREQEEAGFPTRDISRPAPSQAGGGGLVGGLTAAVSPALGPVGGIGAGAAGDATASVGKQTTVATSVAVAPVSAQTATSLEKNFGVSGGSLFIVGHGQTTSPGGSRATMDIFSHMSNDTVITSSSRDFEIGAGAEMQFAVMARSTR
jgi:hypothetical protein